MNTETTDWTNKTKGETYKIWNKNLIIADVHGTQDEISPIYHTPASSTSKSIDEKRVQETANEWKKTSENKEFLINKNKLTSQPIESEYLPDLDKEIVGFCTSKNILSDVGIYYTLIFEIFQNVKDVKITLESDCEIESFKNIRFEVKIADEIENILEREDEFKRKIRKIISKDARMNFVLTIQIV